MMVKLSKMSRIDVIKMTYLSLMVAFILLQSMSQFNPTMLVLARRKPPQGPANFTFYMHIQLYSVVVNNSAFEAVYSAGPFNLSQPNPYNFGVRATFEAPITIGASKNSTQIGVAQGSWVLDSQKYFVLLHIFTATISSGPFKGSLVVVGQEDESLQNRTLAIVGGTGDFLAAHGVAISKRVSINTTLPTHWTLSFDLDLYY